MLRRLVVAAADDRLAARIVLQRLLPGLLAIVRREQQRERDVDAFDLLAAEAWMAIVTYHPDRRPTDIAARLLNDARHRAFTTPRRRQVRSVRKSSRRRGSTSHGSPNRARRSRS